MTLTKLLTLLVYSPAILFALLIGSLIWLFAWMILLPILFLETRLRHRS